MDAFINYWGGGGVLMLPLFAVCALIWYAILTTLPPLRRAVRSARLLQDHLHGLEGRELSDSIHAWLANRLQDDCVVRVARYVFGGRSDRAGIRERLTEAAQAELALLRRHQRMLRAFVAAAPLLGLLGTVQGMVATFTALSSRGTVSMEMLSGGISQALITTQVGLVIALPGLLGSHAIERRLKDLRESFDRLGTHFSAAEVRERTTRMIQHARKTVRKQNEVLV